MCKPDVLMCGADVLMCGAVVLIRLYSPTPRSIPCLQGTKEAITLWLAPYRVTDAGDPFSPAVLQRCFEHCACRASNALSSGADRVFSQFTCDVMFRFRISPRGQS